MIDATEETNCRIYDLIYDYRALPIVRSAFPSAIINDESDDIHEGRFSVDMSGMSRLDWYKWLLRNDWSQVSFMFQMDLRMGGEGGARVAAAMDEVHPGWRSAKKPAPKAERDDVATGLKGAPPPGPLTRQGVRDLNAPRRFREQGK